MMFDWSLAQDKWSDEQQTTWANIEKMWRNFDFINWKIIQSSQEWKGFANQAISNTFNKFANDDIRIKAWRLINLCFLITKKTDRQTSDKLNVI
jgi:hypothetical protein